MTTTTTTTTSRIRARKRLRGGTISVGPRIDAAAHEYLSCSAVTANAAVAYVAEAWPQLIERALCEIREVAGLSADEANALLEVKNGLLLTSEMAGEHLVPELRSAIELGSLDRKWGFDAASLLGRLEALTSFQRAALEMWAVQFWLQETGIDDRKAAARMRASVRRVVGEVAV